ncbi:MAG TPA: cytochrome o ubiquinol oxidase subunit IV [Patescibacteria group bacterium]|nr:cytochrome o ubiquinol oxidase subunit IV [Patescibacteria group bacterium]
MHKPTIKPYIIGFILSIVLTLLAFFIVSQHVTANVFTYEIVITIILCLAVAQLFVQLFFFLHMGKEKKPRWNLFVFVTFSGMILLIVIASLWIMYHLNYNMSGHDMEKKILDKELMELPGYSQEDKQKAIQNR